MGEYASKGVAGAGWDLVSLGLQLVYWKEDWETS